MRNDSPVPKWRVRHQVCHGENQRVLAPRHDGLVNFRPTCQVPGSNLFGEWNAVSRVRPIMKVNIVKLAPMRIASIRALSETPERDAWEKLRAWANPKGLLDDSDKHPVFGFNNPSPSMDRK